MYYYFKRSMDVLAAILLLTLLSPLLLLIGILIKLESKGPIIYASKRVGKNYKVFDFYKFRSMRVGADSEVEKLKHLNNYKGQEKAEIIFSNQQKTLIADTGWVDESEYLMKEQEKSARPFFKLENDPRITKIGHFIRNTSIDELPQLINVLKGELSLVGNRPLPLYEAEVLTTDEAIGRFMAPAGLTGYWQVTERGKKDTSVSKRIELDVTYAQKWSFMMDLKILFKTPLALFQQSNV
ncbi:MAG: sugar transferase [Saprospiraceae bacterium]